MSNRLPDREWLEGSKLGPPNSDATDETAANTMVMIDRQGLADLRRQLAEVQGEAAAMRRALAPLVYLLPDDVADSAPVLYDRDRWGNYSIIVDAGQIRTVEDALKLDSGKALLEEVERLRKLEAAVRHYHEGHGYIERSQRWQVVRALLEVQQKGGEG